MDKRIAVVLTAVALGWVMPVVFAAEHGGSDVHEHGGTAVHEHGGKTAIKTPTAHEIHDVMKAYIEEESKDSGAFDVQDEVTGTLRHLSLVRIHDRVGKTGDYYYSCADFKDTVSGEELDLDLDVAVKDGVLGVVEVRIHKVGGKERYTYDQDDNRIPIK